MAKYYKRAYMDHGLILLYQSLFVTDGWLAVMLLDKKLLCAKQSKQLRRRIQPQENSLCPSNSSCMYSSVPPRTVAPCNM